MFDLHIHTLHSVDSKQTIDEVCESAIQKGLQGIAICDHVDMWFSEKLNTPAAIRDCVEDVRRARAVYGDRLEILQGMEMAEYLYDPKNADMILGLGELDVILGSVHSVAFEEIDDSYSRIDFSSMPEEKIVRFMKKYFFHISEMIEKTDFDVLSHLTCPLRYITGKYGFSVELGRFDGKITEILMKILEKGIALEVNTSCMGTMGQLMPPVSVIRRYYEMGGRLVTLGSDAHRAEDGAAYFEEALEILSNIGFEKVYSFENRRAIQMPI